MFRRMMRAAPLFFLLLCPGLGPVKAQDSFLDRLYRLIWPAGRYKGDLAKAVTKGTQKGSELPKDALTHLYLVDITSQKVSEWPQSFGSSDPVVSPDSKFLFFRSGTTVFVQRLQLQEKQISTQGDPKALPNLKVNHLYASEVLKDGTYQLWIRDTTDKVQLVNLTSNAQSPTIADVPCTADIKAYGTIQLAENLQKLRSLRPDGLQARVDNNRLVWEVESTGSITSLDQPSLQFAGSPVWVTDTGQFLFVNAFNS